MKKKKQTIAMRMRVFFKENFRVIFYFKIYLFCLEYNRYFAFTRKKKQLVEKYVDK